MAATQFFGAFNDNLFKQLLLLIATPTAVAAAAGAADRQSEAMIVFSVAFLLFSGFAGWVSDRYPKRHVIVLSKVAEIVVMLAGTLVFYFYPSWGLWGLFTVLFFMGLQSTFFGPGKYGILPEMLRPSDLPRGNGIFLMLTFLAIISGTALAGGLKEWAGIERLWIASFACVAIAVIGTATSLLVRSGPAASPGLPFRWRDWFVPAEVWRYVAREREVANALVVVSLFWMIGGMVQQAVNALGKTQLNLGDGPTSMMNAMIGLGIALGCLLGGYLSKGEVRPLVVMSGAVGLVVTLLAMSLSPGGVHLLGFRGSLVVLGLLGIATGVFIVPIQVLIQVRPPASEKGRMIALMNQCNWIGIILGAVLYEICEQSLRLWNGPRSTLFAVAAAVMLPIALWYRPQRMRLDGN
jgi:acyl-[acyl-carrier-protein]-phospholipid O-acyltransferase/long-chain-fatty-acid--[acyl-carrier-protein] ligase